MLHNISPKLIILKEQMQHLVIVLKQQIQLLVCGSFAMYMVKKTGNLIESICNYNQPW
jgi:hypothetical protein